ncbi:MAG: PAS domain-containing protein [Alphaproteobacteria bacterium]|nr:PAS domain-containing protein [Alphaproteobacteria bacterium]
MAEGFASEWQRQLAAADAATDPVLLWDDGRRRFAGANAAGLTLLGEQSVLELMRRAFAANAPFVQALAQIAGRLRPDGTAQEFLLLPGDVPVRVSAEIARAGLPDGRMGLKLRVVGVEESPLDPAREAMSAAFQTLSQPAAIFALDGTLVAANEAYHSAHGIEGDRALERLIGCGYTVADLIEQVMGLGDFARTFPVASRVGPRETRVIARQLTNMARGAGQIILELSDVADERAFLARATAEDARDVPSATPAMESGPSADSQAAPLIEALPDPALLLGPGGLIQARNRAAERLLPAAAPGARLGDFLPPAIRADLSDLLDGHNGRGLSRSFEEGREVALAERAAPMLLIVRRVAVPDVQSLAILRDTAATHETVAALTRAREAADAASARKSAFIAAVSHELRTPLNAILGFSEILRDSRFGPLGDHRYTEYARDIHTSGELLLSLVNEILDLSKAEAGRMELRFEGIDLHELTALATRLVAPLAERRQISIESRLDEALPRVVADRRSVTQILLNLLSNAIKYGKTGGSTCVTATTLSDGGVSLAVSDDGPGMNEAELETALKPYGRVNAEETEGTGLGLTLAKALAEANRAEFTIQSSPARGTRARLVFPSPLVLAD